MAKDDYPLHIFTPHYWAKSSNYITGRDAMGIQNSSVIIYTTLLPGLTNVSERIRFYGFHCWVLSLFDKHHGETDSHIQQYNFIRRAELAIAFMMQHFYENYGAVPGKAFANDFLPQLKSDKIFDLKSGADIGEHLLDKKGQKRSYWKFKSGAMGQYYAGVLLALSLIKNKSEFKHQYYLLTDKGRQLANAFATSIPEEAANCLLSIINSGKLKLAELETLQPFALNNILTNSEEWKAYIDLLFEKTKTSQRTQSLIQYLEISNTDFAPSSRLLGEYYFQHPDLVQYEATSASLGWYIYYTQEMIHYSIEHIFTSLLELMAEDNYHPLHGFVNSQVELFEDAITTYKHQPNETLKDWLEIKHDSSPDELREALNQTEYHEDVFYYAMLLMTQTYHSVATRIEVFNNYLTKNNITGRRGSILEIHTYFQQNSKLSIVDFFKKLVYKILNDHQIVAYNKMGNGEAQVHKFVIEHNHLIYINTISPRMTTPRLGTVRYMLQDLGLLDKDTKRPTSLGLDIVQQFKPSE